MVTGSREGWSYCRRLGPPGSRCFSEIYSKAAVGWAGLGWVWYVGVSVNGGTPHVPPKHPKMNIFSRKTYSCWVAPFSETSICGEDVCNVLKCKVFFYAGCMHPGISQVFRKFPKKKLKRPFRVVGLNLTHYSSYRHLLQPVFYK